jgi:hypothetical protein
MSLCYRVLCTHLPVVSRPLACIYWVCIDSKIGRQQRILVDFRGRRRGFLSLEWMLVDGERRGVPKGGLDMRCSLVFALVFLVLKKALLCP